MTLKISLIIAGCAVLVGCSSAQSHRNVAMDSLRTHDEAVATHMEHARQVEQIQMHQRNDMNFMHSHGMY